MRFGILVWMVAISMALTLAGCGGGEKSAPETEAAPPAAETVTAPAGTAKITGTVFFKGEKPSPRKIKQDRECAVLHTEPVYSQNVVVNDNNTLKWVFVYVKDGLGDQKFPTPSEAVVFDQTGCMYDPHVFGIQTGQTLKILNSDPLLHNIHALPNANRPFNFGMPKKGDERERSFLTPEVMVKIKCDVHPWMGAYCGVLDHPFFAVTGDDGTFSLNNLPAGTYTVEAWQEEYGSSSQSVTVADGGSASVDFTFGK